MEYQNGLENLFIIVISMRMKSLQVNIVKIVNYYYVNHVKIPWKNGKKHKILELSNIYFVFCINHHKQKLS